jgi:hypothetical protein
MVLFVGDIRKRGEDESQTDEISTKSSYVICQVPN